MWHKSSQQNVLCWLLPIEPIVATPRYISKFFSVSLLLRPFPIFCTFSFIRIFRLNDKTLCSFGDESVFSNTWSTAKRVQFQDESQSHCHQRPFNTHSSVFRSHCRRNKSKWASDGGICFDNDVDIPWKRWNIYVAHRTNKTHMYIGVCYMIRKEECNDITVYFMYGFGWAAECWLPTRSSSKV